MVAPHPAAARPEAATRDHHDEIHHGEWEIHMKDGVPWIAPPAWINPFRTLLRNATHHAHTAHQAAPAGSASGDGAPGDGARGGGAPGGSDS